MIDYIFVDPAGNDQTWFIYVKSDLVSNMGILLNLYGIPFEYEDKQALFAITASVLWEDGEITKIKEFIAQSWKKMKRH